MPGINKKRKKTTFGIQQLDQWVTIVKEHFPQLSKPQATVLVVKLKLKTTLPSQNALSRTLWTFWYSLLESIENAGCGKQPSCDWLASSEGDGLLFLCPLFVMIHYLWVALYLNRGLYCPMNPYRTRV